jgi:hypothetical protein
MTGLTIYCGECECEHDEPVCPPIPRCDLCSKPTPKRTVRIYRSAPFDPKFQSPLRLCPECWKENT